MQAAPNPSRTGALAQAAGIVRFHIMLIGMTAAVVFGWLMTGRYLWALAVVVGVDWFFINLVNRATDVGEDVANRIPGTEQVARHRRALTWAAFAVLGASLVLTHLAWPQLTPWRIAVALIGLGYSYRIVPTQRGWRRLKEIYFLKNFASAVLFLLTCFAYPLAIETRIMNGAAVVSLAVFFVAFEMTYEILYDLRDLEGDRTARIPTFPVVHGARRARQIVDGLLALAALVLAAAFLAGAIGLREVVMIAAPAAQLAFYRPRLRRGLTPRDCIRLTHLGTAQLILYLLGTAAWLRLGLPPNWVL